MNTNPVLRMGSYRVDDTLGVATAMPTISVTNAASRLLTTTPYSTRKHCVRTRNPYVECNPYHGNVGLHIQMHTKIANADNILYVVF